MENMNRKRFDEIYDSLEHVGQDKKEFFWLVNKVEELKPHTIVEIGVDEGGSLKFWEELIDDEGLVVGIDEVKRISWNYKNNKKDVRFILGSSYDPNTIKRLEQILNGRKIDFLFIDADKSKIEIDFENYSKFVRKGGLVGVHDIKIGQFPKEGRYEGEMQEAGKFFESLVGHKECVVYDIGTGIWWKE